MPGKAHRKAGHLEIRSLHMEPHNFEDESVIAALVDAIGQFCHFQQCDTVSLTEAQPRHWGRRLRRALPAAARE